MVRSILAFVILAVACGTARWEQDPAVRLPHIVTQVAGVEAVLDDDGSSLFVRADCLTEADLAGVDVVLVKGDRTETASIGEVPCMPGRSLVVAGFAKLGRLSTGEVVEVTLRVDDGSMVDQQSVSFMVGTDHRLRLGLDSVRRVG